MSLVTYTDLQAQILAFMGRPTDTIIPTDICIQLCEANLNRRLRTHWQESTINIPTVVAQASYALPGDFLEVRELSITSTSPVFVLDYLSPAQLDDTWGLSTTSLPANYTLESTNLRLGPLPDAVYTLRLEYFATIPALATNTTNWLMGVGPDLYLYGSLTEAEIFLGGDGSSERGQFFRAKSEEAYQSLMLRDRKYRTGRDLLTMRVSNVWCP